MNKPTNFEMIILAREARGLTQSELAEKLSVSQGQLSKIESGVLEVPAPLLARLSAVLDFPEQFFAQSESVYGPGTGELFHRKRQSLPQKMLNKIHAEINIRRMHIATLLHSVEIENRYHFYDACEFESPEDVARVVRATWQLPRGPIQNMTQVIEHAGGIVVPCDFKTPLLDAISRWYPKMPPLFFTNVDVPGDRLRFTLAHELGHLFLHNVPNANMEDEANRFAAEFLMPAQDITPSLFGVTLEKLAVLKRYWKVAMSAILHRAQELGTISQRMAKRLWIQMSKAGYMKREPVELSIPIETPSLLQEIIEVYRGELKYSVPQLGQVLALNDHEVRSLYLGQKASLMLVRRAKGVSDPNPQAAG